MSAAGRRYIRLGSLGLLLCAGLLVACSGGTTNIFQLPSANPSGVPTSSSTALASATPTARASATPTALASATPTALASATPTAPPSGVLSVNPIALSINGIGAAQSVDVQEIGYSGAFNESDTCAGVATVAPSLGGGPSATFTVTSSAAGTCSATFTDATSQHLAVAITVTTTGFTVNDQ